MKDKKIIINLFFTVIILFVIQFFASNLGSIVASLFNYTAIDKDNVFMKIAVHHIIQMLVALLIIFIIGKTKNIKFNLKPKINSVGVKYTIVFSVIIFIYVIISYLIGCKTNSISPSEYELNMVNVLGTLGFQLFLSGTSEEILFRALPINILERVLCEKKRKNQKFEIITAAILFSLAHITWTFNPISCSFNVFQLIYAFILGLVYGIAYTKSKSIVYPAIMHGMSNFFMVGIGYIFQILI